MSEQRVAPAQPAFRRWIGVVGLFIAPTTVSTSLCYYFGYVYARKYFDYFGIDSNALGFTTGDYVIRSVRPLFLPIVALLFAWVAVLWAAEYLRRLVHAGRNHGWYVRWRGQ